MQLELIQFNSVASVIKPHIEEIGRKAQRPFFFEDVERACLEKRAFLFMSPDKKTFTVLKPMPNKVVLVWVAHSTLGNCIEQFEDTLLQYSKEIGAETLEFETSLRSLERLMKGRGWNKAYTVWRMPIE